MRKYNYIQARYLWFLTLSYSMVMVLANWFDARLISIFGVVTDAGTLIFPFTFLLSDLITEVYGYKKARLAIWCGFLFNAIFIVYAQVVIHLPSPNFETQNAAFDAILSMNGRIILASTLAYLCSEPLNSFTMAKLKIKTQGRYMSIRFILANVFGSGVDSLIFGVIAFYDAMSLRNLIILILTMWLIKVIAEMLGLPISVRLAKKLKILEELDIYDTDTKFKPFSLESDYTQEENQYIKPQLNSVRA